MEAIRLKRVTYDEGEDAILIHTQSGSAEHSYGIPGRLVEGQPDLAPLLDATVKGIAGDYADAGIEIDEKALRNGIGIKLGLFRDAGPKSLA